MAYLRLTLSTGSGDRGAARTNSREGFSDGGEFESYRLGRSRWGRAGELLHPIVLDSRNFTFCLILWGESVQQQATQNRLVLDSGHNHFSVGMVHLRFLRLRHALYQKPVVDEDRR